MFVEFVGVIYYIFLACFGLGLLKRMIIAVAGCLKQIQTFGGQGGTVPRARAPMCRSIWTLKSMPPRSQKQFGRSLPLVLVFVLKALFRFLD